MVFRGSKYATLSRSLGRVLSKYVDDESMIDKAESAVKDFLMTSDLNLEKKC